MLEILYTDTDKIRSTLGLSTKDMPDEQLTVRGLDKELAFDLAGWVSNHSSLVEKVNMGTATQTEIDVVDAINLYSTYFCSSLVVPSLQMAALKSLSDGKNAADRFANVDWNKMLDQIRERATFYRSYIITNNIDVTTSNTYSYKPFSSAGNAIDPVTG